MERSDRLRIWDQVKRPLILPSLLACDFSRMSEELEALKRAGVAAVHLDVMDGHFVPNISYGAPLIARWRERCDFPFDTHLMISDPGRYAGDFIAAGCDSLIIHIEAVADPVDLLREIKRNGCRACLALNPATPLAAIEPFLQETDGVLVMSVVPGFGGQEFDASVLEKVKMLRSTWPLLPVGIDGGINPKTAGSAVAAGASHLVAGSAVFRSGGDYAHAIAELAKSAADGSPRGSLPDQSAGGLEFA